VIPVPKDDRYNPLPLNPGNIQHPLTAQRAPVGCSMFDVGCWMLNVFPPSVQGFKARQMVGVFSPGLARQGGGRTLDSGTMPRTTMRVSRVPCHIPRHRILVVLAPAGIDNLFG
jgi:hypothetical protein